VEVTAVPCPISEKTLHAKGFPANILRGFTLRKIATCLTKSKYEPITASDS